MDWGAIGAVAAVIAVGIGFIQIRQHGRKKVEHAAPPPAPVKPPPLKYKIFEGSGAIEAPDYWKELEEKNYQLSLRMFRSKFERLAFCHIFLRNQNEISLGNIRLEYSAYGVHSIKTEYARSLGKSAIDFNIRDDGLVLIGIDSMPPGEDIIITLLAERVYSTLKSLNSSVELVSNWGHFDW